MPGNVHSNPYIIHPSDELAKNIDLRNLTRSLATKYADGHVVTDDDLQIMGRMLWNALGVQDEFDAAVRAAGDAILSIIIESDRPEVQAFPWETLYHPTHGFIGRNSAFTLTRRIAEGKPAQGNLDKGPLRVLLFTSLPDNVDAERGRLNVEEEQAQVQEALLPWIAKGVVQLEMPDDGRFSTLKELLKRFDPHVLFLSGHGNFHYQPHADEAYGEFLFESETGDVESIRDEEIAQPLVGTGVQVVMISTCESGKAASDALSNGLMQRISAAGIPHVIGMRESIHDVAGIQFARALCDALAGQERLDVALQSARIAIQSSISSYRQWCLPMALSPNPQAPLIDWDFDPQVVELRRLNQRVRTINMPARFVGRRSEMRKYKSKLLQGLMHSLLITGAGGTGKTSLAGKLALDVQKARGGQLFAWSAHPENSWRDFELEMGQTLDRTHVERYDKFLPKAENEVERAKFMLDLLVEQFNGRVILFFDDLETLQDADSLAVKDATVAAWMQAALGTDGVTVFATSRWQIPGWDGEHLMLAHANYGDFLQIVAMKNLPIRREQMRRVYDALGGNIRGLEFFAAAAESMDDENAEETFLQTLEQTKSDLQANMAIAEIYKRLPDDAKALLHRLPVYDEPVPLKGLISLGLDFPNPEELLERLLAFSLLEIHPNFDWDVVEYKSAQMVTDWMKELGVIDINPQWLNIAADYYLYLFNNERKTLTQAVITHHALRRIERNNEADRLTLDYIVSPMTMAGFYTTLLSEWLPRIYKSEDRKTRSKAFEQTGKLLYYLGNFQSALSYFDESLIITQQIGDKMGEGAILNNISQIYDIQGEYETALNYLKQSLSISLKIGDKLGEGAVRNNISQVYYVQGDYKTALAYLQQALDIRQQIGDKVGESSTLNNISQIYHAYGDYKAALSYLKQSLALAQYIGDKAGESVALNNISQIYHAEGDYHTALAYLKGALTIRQQIGDKVGEGTTLTNIGNIFYAQGNYEVAQAYLQQSLAIHQNIRNTLGEGIALGLLGCVYVATGEIKTSIELFTQQLTVAQKIQSRKNIADSLRNFGNAYHRLGDNEKSLEFFSQSLSLVREVGDYRTEIDILGRLGEISFLVGNIPNATDFYEQVLNALRSIVRTPESTKDKARRLNVFICCSSVDKALAVNFYQLLKNYNIDIWFDQESLLPGQDKDFEIENAIQRSDVNLICLSEKSMRSEGYIHKGITHLLDRATKIPEGTIFIIPCRLDEKVALPPRLMRFTPMDTFDFDKTENLNKLMQSLRLRAADIDIEIEKF